MTWKAARAWTPSNLGRTTAVLLLCLFPVAGIRQPSVASQGNELACGRAVIASLNSGKAKEQEFTFVSARDDSVVVFDVADVSGTLDLLKVEAEGSTTCAGSVALRAPQGKAITVHVSDCFGDDSGDFVLTASVVSAGSENCSRPLPCGTVPFVRRFLTPGETQAYSFFARAGDDVAIWAGRGVPRAGEQRMRLRLYGPDGAPVTGGDSCGGRLPLRAPVTGTYTLLVSTCDKPESGVYWLAFDGPSCPVGPEITYMGIARPDGVSLQPDDYDAEGRPVYRFEQGFGFTLIVEAQPGRSQLLPGSLASVEPRDAASVWPDLQVLLSRPLGDGNPAVCDSRRPNLGGVPATPELEFAEQPRVIQAVNDFGCRVDDGTGNPLGRTESETACTSFPDGSFRFVSPRSTVQFCVPIFRSWEFRSGSTLLKARLRDTGGNWGWPREMVVEVAGPLPPLCVGDCNEDGVVTVDEIVLGVRVALGEENIARCVAMDRDSDGSVTIDEILQAVTHALAGCP